MLFITARNRSKPLSWSEIQGDQIYVYVLEYSRFTGLWIQPLLVVNNFLIAVNSTLFPCEPLTTSSTWNRTKDSQHSLVKGWGEEKRRHDRDRRIA